MGELEVQVMYEQSARDGGDDLLMAAVENAPRAFPLVSPEVRDGGIQARAMRHSPAEAAKLRDLRQVRRTLQEAIKAARSELERAGLPGDDLVSRVARGEVAMP